MKPKTEKKGFTLFEMLVVTAILGLIMVIAIPNYLKARNNAMAHICASNQKMIYTAASMFMNSEEESLEAMGHKERLDALIEKGYIKGNNWCECPSGKDGSYDDYTLIFQDGYISDVQCDRKPADHVWP